MEIFEINENLRNPMRFGATLHPCTPAPSTPAPLHPCTPCTRAPHAHVHPMHPCTSAPCAPAPLYTCTPANVYTWARSAMLVSTPARGYTVLKI